MRQFVRKAPRAPRFRLWLASLALLLAPLSAFATHADIARLATQLNMATSQLAYELRGSGAHSSIRQRSEQLSREAADLVNAVRRNRNPNQVRAQFQDVTQRFASLEQAFLRLHQRDFNPYLYNEYDRISSIYTSLSSEFYYQGSYDYAQPYVYNPPVIIYQGVPNSLYQPPRGFVNPGSIYKAPAQQRDRRDYGRRQVLRQPLSGHRSAVLDRQQRLDNRRQGYERTRRGAGVETSRRNHYE